MDIFIFGLAGAFSFSIIKWKLTHERKADAILDGFMMVILMYVLGDSATGGAVALVMSALISVYLIFDPLTVRFPRIQTPSRSLINKINYSLIAIFIIAVAIYTIGVLL